MNKTEFDLAELELHLESLKIYQEKELPSDVKENLNMEINFLEKKIKELK